MREWEQVVSCCGASARLKRKRVGQGEADSQPPRSALLRVRTSQRCFRSLALYSIRQSFITRCSVSVLHSDPISPTPFDFALFLSASFRQGFERFS